MKKNKITLIMILFFFIGLLVLLYPAISSYYNEKVSTKAIFNYESLLENNPDQEKYQKMFEEAKIYNQKLLNLKEPLIEHDTIDGYKNILNINNTGMMGYLTINKIKVELPIYHGTSQEVLGKSVGHLEGTSFPIGEKGTHTVLSAHRGLPSSKLFTDLDKLEIGDKFTLTILDKTFNYEVDKITIVSPKELDEVKIDKDSDYITLLTCTPYGINTHRLLVRGKRVEGNKKNTYISTEGYSVNKLIVMPLVALPIILTLFLIILFKPVKRNYKDIYIKELKNKLNGRVYEKQ